MYPVGDQEGEGENTHGVLRPSSEVYIGTVGTVVSCKTPEVPTPIRAALRPG